MPLTELHAAVADESKPVALARGSVNGATLQRLWTDTLIDYSAMQHDKQGFRTGQVRRHSLKDRVETFLKAVRTGKQKPTREALRKLVKRLEDDQHAKIQHPKSVKAWSAGDKAQAHLQASAFYAKWLTATREHLDHLDRGGLADLERAYATTTTTIPKETKAEQKVEEIGFVENEELRNWSEGEFTSAQLDEHMVAYRKARYYHASKRTAFPGILNEGLDAARRGKGGADEAQSFNTGTDPRVFLGGDATTTRYYKRQLGEETDIPHFRAFLSPGEVAAMIGDMADADNLAYWRPTSVLPEQLILGSMRYQPTEKLRTIFAIVRQHYPPNTDIDVDEVIQRHLAAIQAGRTTHVHGQYAEKPGHGRGRMYQYPDEGYESD